MTKATLLAAAWLFTSILGSWTWGKEPVPPAEERRKIEQLIDEAFRQEANGVRLADRLEARAAEQDVTPAERFVLRKRAVDAYARAGLMDRAVTVMEMLIDRYDVDPLASRHETLLALSTVATLPDDQRLRLLAMLGSHSSASEIAGRPELADAAIAAARTVAGSKSKKAAKLQKEVQKLVEAHRRQRGLMSELNRLRAQAAAEPTDAVSRRKAGTILCFEFGHWAEGLPLLGEGDQPNLKETASKDLANPKSAPDQLTVADGWWDIAEELLKTAPAHSTAAKRRAGYWYAQCVDGLSGLSKDVAKQRLGASGWQVAGQVANGAGADVAAGSSGDIDVLALCDPSRDALAGNWKRNDDGSVSGDWARQARVELPYELPEEYELTVDLTLGNIGYENENCGVFLILPKHRGTDSFRLSLGVNRGKRWNAIGVHNVQKKHFGDPTNPTSHRLEDPVFMDAGERHVLVLSNTAKELVVRLDNKDLYRLRRLSDLGESEASWRLLKPVHFGISTDFTDITLHSVRLRPIGKDPGKAGVSFFDEGMSAAAASRDAGVFNGTRYKHFPIELKFTTARRFCAAIGGSLLNVQDPGEHEYITRFVREIPGHSWVDLEHKNGQWVGPDGAPARYLTPAFDQSKQDVGGDRLGHIGQDGNITPVHEHWWPVAVICEWDRSATKAAEKDRRKTASSGLFDDQ